MAADYCTFIEAKENFGAPSGFKPLWLPDTLFDFQRRLADWAIRKGRAAIFADCGLGKTAMQLVWAENVVRHTNGYVLIIAPLAVSYQTLREAAKFGIECGRSVTGDQPSRITVTNYERLHYFDPSQFVGVVCDESSILKSFDGVRRAEITEFMRRLPYRLLCTATAAPNDYIELGTSSEALGELGHMDMLHRFFRAEGKGTHLKRFYGQTPQWRFKHHAKVPFWQWVCSWARAIRRPSDMNCDDGRFSLPLLIENENVVQVDPAKLGRLFESFVVGMQEEREERRRSLRERCERMAMLAGEDESFLVWCHLNDEGNLLEKLIPDAVQVAGSDAPEIKEERLIAFADGQIATLITKPRIGAFGLNLQTCAHIGYFPSYSYEQYYQGVRRCWRFGQQKPVVVDIVLTESERRMLSSLRHKAQEAGEMFTALIGHMNNAMKVSDHDGDIPVDVPRWL